MVNPIYSPPPAPPSPIKLEATPYLIEVRALMDKALNRESMQFALQDIDSAQKHLDVLKKKLERLGIKYQ